jgi:integrase
MNARVVLTDKLVKALTPGDKRYDVLDALVPGLLASVNPGGTVTLMLRTRKGSKTPIRRAIGQAGHVTVEQARRTARQWLELLYNGGDPREVQRLAREEQRRVREAADARAGNTFAVVADKFFTHRLKEQRRGFVVERIIRNELMPLWGNRPIAEISHRDVREAVERVIERGAATYAHNVFQAASALFGYAVERDLLENNPCDRLKRKRLLGAKKRRERTLDNDELRALWRAASRMSYPFGPLYQLLALTGARLREVADARWSEFNLREATWTIPAERFKTGQQHQVPLTADALAVLAALPHFRRGDYLFSTSFGDKPVSSMDKPKTRLDRRMLRTLKALALLRGDDPAGVTLAPFVNHDIRRSVRTRLSELRVPEHIAEQVIGHSRKGIVANYDMHRFADEKREALTAWQALLRSFVQPTTADNVVSLRGQGA